MALAPVRRHAVVVLIVGVVLRVATFVLMSPSNRDWHLGVVVGMAGKGRLLLSNEAPLSFHPPLYYLLAAPIFALTSRPKIVQMLSLVLCMLTLLVFYRLIWKTPIFDGERDRLPLLALVSVHPQVIAYGLFISNDTLAMLLGALIAWQLWQFLEDPSPARRRVLALLAGAGLLTKASFLGVAPVLIVVVWFVMSRTDRRQAAKSTLEFTAIAIVVGSYKYLENTLSVGRPFVSDLDAGGWVAEQARGRVFPWAYLGFDLRRLIVEPMALPRRPPAFELLYQTFWYEWLPQSNIVEARHWPFTLAGSAVLIVALIPTALVIVGALRIARGLRGPLRSGAGPLSSADALALYRAASIAMPLAILLIMVREEFASHVWSILHARLLLPGLAGALVALHAR